MSYTIGEACVVCGACVAECPERAISESDGRSVVDANVCTGCGTCADACPVGACRPR